MKNFISNMIQDSMGINSINVNQIIVYQVLIQCHVEIKIIMLIIAFL